MKLIQSASAASRALRPTAVDLFAGCGGLTMGLKEAGFDIRAAIEIESRAVETYVANHPDVYVVKGDIRDVPARRLMRTLGMDPGDLDLLAGCPPCQGFSRLPTRNGSSPKSDLRNDLVFDFVRFVRAFLPKTLMFENVPGLVRDKRFAEVQAQLRKLGYQVEARVLDASEFGVPQRRARLIVLGARRPIVVAHAASQAARATVRSAIGNMPKPGQSGDPLHDQRTTHAAHVMRLIRTIPKDGGSRNDLPERLQLDCHRKTTGFNDVYGRMRWDAPSPTITSGCINPSKGRFIHPAEDRAITLREASLLQGFPKGYVFFPCHGKEAVAAMIGNALPPPFIAAHAKAIHASIKTARRFRRT